MDVVFLSPGYPPEMRQYVRGLAEVGARVWGVGDSAPDHLGEAAQYLAGYLPVPRIGDEDDVLERASAWLRGKDIQRVLANWEILVDLAARMREAWGVPGMTVDEVRGFRDKQLMKERVEAAGLRVPRAERARSKREVHEAAQRVGFPLVIKPIAGAGSADTYAIASEAELDEVLPRLDHITEVSIEEYVAGEEFTYDTVCIQGQPAFENVAQYLPKPLEARSEEWISPVIITVRDLDQPKLAGGLELGRGVLKALAMGDGFTHMEWFLTDDGEAVFGEIGCRPGGAHLVDQMNYTCDIDLFREWARAVCWHRFDADTTRKYNCGIVFKRAKGRGMITEIRGLEDVLQAWGEHLVEERLLRPGTTRRDWRRTLVSDGYLIVRHPDWETSKRLAFLAATELDVVAQ